MSLENFNDLLKTLKENNNYRELKVVSKKGNSIFFNNNSYINFSSNDYLGISANTSLWNSFIKNVVTNCNEFIGSNCSSRLLSGNSNHYKLFENFLKKTYNSSGALLLNSGYHANIGVLPAITTKNDLIIDDKFVHASLVDGIRLSSATNLIFEHNNIEQLEKILKTKRHLYKNVFIVIESVYSMDGDFAPLKQIVELKEKYNAFLYVDEAHAIGTFGNLGLGLLEQLNLIDKADFIIGTLGKAVASQGAFVICNKTFEQFLINKMRSLIFTTALPPINILWSHYIFKKILKFNKHRNYLNDISTNLKTELNKLGFVTKGDSHIIPIIIGDNSECLNISDYLLKNGFFILPIRPPTVPVNTARLRLSLNAKMNINIINDLISVLKKYNEK